MEAPTITEVRDRSHLLTDLFPSPAKDDDLALLIATAAPLVGALTGRIIAGTEGEDVPTGMLELARRAITLKAEQLNSVIGSTDDREDSIDRGRLRSIAAGSWSESYWGPGEAAQGKQLDSDPVLAEILWALCTDDKKAEWLELWDPANSRRPASAIEAFDYSQRPGSY